MSFSLIPQWSFPAVTDVSPEFLAAAGIRFLMLDLDNTIASYGEHSPSDEIVRWAAGIKDSGVAMAIVSNSSRVIRVAAFAEALDVGSVIRASKPSPAGLLHSMETAGFPSGESALAGDQVFTDTLAANRAGVLSIIVKPRKFTNPFLAIRYAIEIPFRSLARKKVRSA